MSEISTLLDFLEPDLASSRFGAFELKGPGEIQQASRSDGNYSAAKLASRLWLA
jgi:hypothetical protein